MKYRTAIRSTKLRRISRLSQTLFRGVLLVAGLLTVGYFTPRRWDLTQLPCHAQPFKIYAAGEAMHVNLVLPVKNSAYNWQQFLNLQKIGHDTQENYQYLKFGWGDRGFYMETPSWAQMNLTNALRALFKPGNPSVMYVKGYSNLPVAPGLELRCIALSQDEYLNLVKFLKNSFQQTGGKPIHLQYGSEPSSGFYAAIGNYSALRTCNTWAAEGLDAANVPTPLWSGLASSVMMHIQSNVQKDCVCK